MDEANSYIEKLKGGVAYYPALIALHTGMRAGEILALTWNDIDFENNTITIDKTMLYTNGITSIGPSKTDKSYRTISFGAELNNILQKYKIEQFENYSIMGSIIYNLNSTTCTIPTLPFYFRMAYLQTKYRSD